MKNKRKYALLMLLAAIMVMMSGLQGSSARVLKIMNLRLSPNPFTPHSYYPAMDGGEGGQGLRIRFEVDTLSRFFWLTITVHNVEGNIVRRLTELLEPMYTDYDKLEPKEIIIWWDGKNDYGQYANNGRYIVHIKVSDTEAQTFSTETIKPVVLIK